MGLILLLVAVAAAAESDASQCATGTLTGARVKNDPRK